MLLILSAVVLVLAIVFYQAVLGLYNALVMTLATIISASAAIAYFEWISPLITNYQPLVSFADAIALVGLFFVILLVLRFLADGQLRSNVLLGAWTNRIGGGLFGLITGILCVGILTIGVQLLPFGASILGYKPFDDSLRPQKGFGPFYPDIFTAGFVDLLSVGSMSSQPDKPFSRVHDNLPLEAFCWRNTAGKNGRIDAPKGSMRVIGAFNPRFDQSNIWLESIPANPLTGARPTNVVIVRTSISQNAGDTDGWLRLPATHFRLITNTGESHYPVGYLVRSGNIWQGTGASMQGGLAQIARLSVDFDHPASPAIVNWIYRIPNDQIPDTLVFRRMVYQAVSQPVVGTPD